jgi:hypothetical protein
MSINTNFGTDSLSNNIGSNNSAFGSYSQYNTTDASCNTSSGINSLFNNTLGSNNTALGAGSILNNTIGQTNTAVGSSSLANNLTGNLNVAVGGQALYNLTNGDSNTVLGSYAGLNLTSGYNNTLLGSNTHFNNSSVEYNNSTAVGTNAVITGSSQIVLGTSNENVLFPGNMQLTGTSGINYIEFPDGTTQFSASTTSATNNLEETLINGDSAGFYNITDVSNINVLSINGIVLKDRSLSFQRLLNQTIPATSNNQFAIAIPVIVTLANGGYALNTMVQILTVPAVSEIILRVFIGTTQISESIVATDTAVFTNISLVISPIPFEVSNGPLQLTLTGQINATQNVNIIGGAGGSSFIGYNKLYIDVQPPPQPPQWRWTNLGLIAPAFRQLTQICCSSSGTLFSGSLSNTNLLVTSTDSGSSISFNNALPESAIYSCMANSDDGLKLYTGSSNNENIMQYKSINQGVSWVKKGFVMIILSMATSTDGLVVFGGSNKTQIVISLDSGENYSKIKIPSPVLVDFGSVAMSRGNAGTIMIVSGTGSGGYLIVYRSADQGTTFVEVSLPSAVEGEGLLKIAMDNTGQYVVLASNKRILTSTDFGVIFTERMTGSFSGVTSDSTGQYIAVLPSNGLILVSSNYGVTYTETAIIKSWTSIASNAVGNKLYATDGIYIYGGMFF